MSRYSGCWVGVEGDRGHGRDLGLGDRIRPDRARTSCRTDFDLPPGGLNIRWPDPPLAQELRLHTLQDLRGARLCPRQRARTASSSTARSARLGIVTTGKAYLDVRQALDDLGIDEALAAEIGLRLYKVGMPWPLEPEGVRHFAEGLEEILVVEEKRQLIEYQLKEQLYNWREDVRPRVVGKFDEDGEWEQPQPSGCCPRRASSRRR